MAPARSAIPSDRQLVNLMMMHNWREIRFHFFDVGKWRCDILPAYHVLRGEDPDIPVGYASGKTQLEAYNAAKTDATKA